MQQRKASIAQSKRKTQKDFVKSRSPRMGTVYDTVAFNNYQAERISAMMSTGPTGMPYYKSTGTMIAPDRPKFKMGK